MRKTLKNLKLLDYSKKRNTKNAVVFYIFYLFLIVFVAAFIGAIAGLLIGKDFDTQRQIGINMGLWISVVSCLAISSAILQKKNLEDDVKIIVIALFSGPLAYFGGTIFGLLPSLFLSTLGRKRKT